VNVEDAFDKIFKAIRNKSLPVSLTELMWSSFQAQTACPLGCICDEQEKWKTEELLLNHLQLVEIIGLRGSQYEVSFVKQVFNWVKALKWMKTWPRSCLRFSKASLGQKYAWNSTYRRT
jgi:hypothetical protein